MEEQKKLLRNVKLKKEFSQKGKKMCISKKNRNKRNVNTINKKILPKILADKKPNFA